MKFIKFFVRLIVIFNIFIYCSATNLMSQSNLIKLATLEWPPYVSKKVKGMGFTSEIANQTFKKAGYDVKIYFMPWAKVLKDVERGKYDAGFPAYYSKQRNFIYGLSKMIAKGPLVFAKRKDSPIDYKQLTDLKKFKIGIVRGYVNTTEFDNANYLKKEIGNSDEQNLRKLLKKRLDLVVIDKYTAIHILKTKIIKEKESITFLNIPLEEKGLYVAFSKKKSDYKKKLDIFNTAFDAITKEGLIDKIMKKYDL